MSIVCPKCNGEKKYTETHSEYVLNKGYKYTHIEHDPCERCEGKGRTEYRTMTCPKCHGEKIWTEIRKEKVKKETKEEKCHICMGTSKIIVNQQCPECAGTKKKSIKKEVNNQLVTEETDEACPNCNGTGIIEFEDCVCGTGKRCTDIFEEETKEIKHPCERCEQTGITNYEICYRCDGRGETVDDRDWGDIIDYYSTCNICHGTGKLYL